MDRRQAVLAAKDLKAVTDCYAEDACALTPDEGELEGRDQILRYLLAIALTSILAWRWLTQCTTASPA
jgi:ketosteroid isomerase-like protein